MVNEKPSTHNAQPNFTPYALRFTLSTLNSQPATHFGANAPPTCHFYALRIRFTHHELRPFSKIANFAVKSVKSRITNHAPDGYQMTTEVVII
jgi:hypothetical protein